jgi:CRISPR-associated endonuclease/helicase Cas3
LAAWAGWLHDLGKYRDEVQEYLAGLRTGGPETRHAVFGAAQAARDRLPSVALAVLGHHAGLPDWPHAVGQIKDPALDPLNVSEALIRRLERDRHADPDPGDWPAPVAEFLNSGRRGLRATFGQELAIRMLFSCLVDADYLDTERYMTGLCRAPLPFQAAELFERLDRHVGRLAAGGDPTPVNEVRRAVYEACLGAAGLPPGCYSLTAPTGSGKTLAMMAFALKHAEAHRLRRVIVVLPFLAIIEQNARVYREALRGPDGSDPVVEHHSAAPAVAGPGESDADPSENETTAQARAKQAAENWDAPVVVTTAVQFLESLFARRPGRCRKLHNLARSVVVFDEAQTLPFPLLDPTLSVVRDLRDHYGVSFLFGSATQPRFERAYHLPGGFGPGECRPVADPSRTFVVLRRASLALPFLGEGCWSWDDLADRLPADRRALIIVNLRKHAQDFYDRLKSRGVPGLFHLSSTMCPAHRAAVLGRKDDPAPGTIYHALKSGGPCVVASTQVVEAGVDIDFPVVFRAVAPLDAVIQAAGRCDREGEATRRAGAPAGRVIVFEPAAEPATPPGFYTEATLKARAALEGLAADPDRLLSDPGLFADYHGNLIAWGTGRERGRAVQEARARLGFREVAGLFRLIEEAGQGVVVRHGESPALLDSVRSRGYASRDDRRLLQPFTVNLFPTWVARLQADLRPVLSADEGLVEFLGQYDPDVGLRLGELPVEQFIV